MTLNLLPGRPSPFRADAARGELLRLWDGLDLEGRRLVLANARAVSDVTGRPARPVAPRHRNDPVLTSGPPSL